MNILSIQSHVAYGHVGNSAAVFALQRIGVEVWPVHTVQFSNHPGYGGWRGDVFSGEAIRQVVQGIADRGVLTTCNGVLSGYLGSRDAGEAVVEAVACVKRANPAALYCCDPVIGDADRGIYVRNGIPEFIKSHMLPIADIVTPNQFELTYLAGLATPTRSPFAAATGAIHALGPRAVFVTSLTTDDTPDDAVDLAVSDGDGRYRVRTPRLPIAVNGAGDAIAALFFAHYLKTRSAAKAISLAASSIFGVLERTAATGGREMLLVEAQDELTRPSRVFDAQRI
jgi:pyridoxine kinase